MKAFVLAERTDAAAELCAGARTMADEVVLVAVADMEVPAACADINTENLSWRPARL